MPKCVWTDARRFRGWFFGCLVRFYGASLAHNEVDKFSILPLLPRHSCSTVSSTTATTTLLSPASSLLIHLSFYSISRRDNFLCLESIKTVINCVCIRYLPSWLARVFIIPCRCLIPPATLRRVIGHDTL